MGGSQGRGIRRVPHEQMGSVGSSSATDSATGVARYRLLPGTAFWRCSWRTVLFNYALLEFLTPSIFLGDL